MKQHALPLEKLLHIKLRCYRVSSNDDGDKDH